MQDEDQNSQRGKGLASSTESHLLAIVTWRHAETYSWTKIYRSENASRGMIVDSVVWIMQPTQDERLALFPALRHDGNEYFPSENIDNTILFADSLTAKKVLGIQNNTTP